jgi:hypothetical protein
MVATLFFKPPWWRSKALAGAILFLSLIVLGLWGMYAAFQHGVGVGLTTYHNMCYNNGGFIIIDGKAVICGKLAEIPKKELDNFPKT